MFRIIILLLSVFNTSSLFAGSIIGGNTNINTTVDSIVNIALGNRSQAITQIGSIHQSQVNQAVNINITMGKVINIAKGNQAKGFVSVGSVQNTQIDEVDSHIHLQNIYNISSRINQENSVIIGYK